MTTTKSLATAVADAFGRRRDLEEERDEEERRHLNPAISVKSLEDSLRTLLSDEQVSGSLS